MRLHYGVVIWRVSDREKATPSICFDRDMVSCIERRREKGKTKKVSDGKDGK